MPALQGWNVCIMIKIEQRANTLTLCYVKRYNIALKLRHGYKTIMPKGGNKKVLNEKGKQRREKCKKERLRAINKWIFCENKTNRLN